MRVLFIQQDHMSPIGPVGEAFADQGLDVQEFMVPVLGICRGGQALATALGGTT
jgi:GMP synthase-like glutamine amidotransferase